MKRLTEIHVPAEWESSLLEGLGEVPRPTRLSRSRIAIVAGVLVVLLTAVAVFLFHYP